MARRELSSTLKNLKFMQRASVREEKTNKEDGVKPYTTTTGRKCVVLVEGDPHPSALKGRMSFQNFNPSFEKLIAEEETQTETTVSKNQSENLSIRENNSLQGQNKNSYKVKDNAKREHGEVVCEAQHPRKSHKNGQGNRQSSPNHCLVSFKKPRRDVIDWNALRSTKCQTK